MKLLIIMNLKHKSYVVCVCIKFLKLIIKVRNVSTKLRESKSEAEGTVVSEVLWIGGPHLDFAHKGTNRPTCM